MGGLPRLFLGQEDGSVFRMIHASFDPHMPTHAGPVLPAKASPRYQGGGGQYL